MLASKSTHGFLKINDVSTICTPNTTVTGRFANGSFANVSGQFANVQKSVRKRYKHLHVNLGLTIQFRILHY